MEIELTVTIDVEESWTPRDKSEIKWFKEVMIESVVILKANGFDNQIGESTDFAYKIKNLELP